MLNRITIPGLVIVGTDTGVGKTLIAAAIGQWLGADGQRVAVAKPCATGCVHRREGLVSEDAEFLAHCTDSRFPLDLICPQRYAEPLAPSVAADRAGRPLEWESIDKALAFMAKDSDVMVVEGIGGVMVPMDQGHTFLDVIAWLGLPVVVVARAELGTINHTLLTLMALRSCQAKIVGVVINGYPTDTPTTAQETNPRVIEKWGKVPILCVVPQVQMPKDILHSPPIPAGVAAAIRIVDWMALAR